MDGEPPEIPAQASVEKAQVEPLFGKSYELKAIKPNSVIPIGGNAFSDELTTGVTADLDFFNPIVEQMKERAGAYKLDGLKQWLETSGIAVEPSLFAKLYAFTQVLEKKYPISPEVNSTRDETYAQAHGGQVKMSQIFESGNAACAEIAALAQHYLQEEAVQSSFFTGEVLWNKDHEFAEPHSFILIRDKDNQFVYDPANPTNTTQGNFPSIYTTQLNFDQEVRKDQKRFVPAKNVISKKEAYYGVGNGTNVTLSSIAA